MNIEKKIVDEAVQLRALETHDVFLWGGSLFQKSAYAVEGGVRCFNIFNNEMQILPNFAHVNKLIHLSIYQ